MKDIKIDNEEKLFMFYDSDDRNPHPEKGPYHYGDYIKIGQKFYHTLEDLMKTHYSEAVKKRLSTAKMGTKIKLFKFHSCGDYYIKRISRTEAEKLDILNSVEKQLTWLKSEAYKAESEISKFCDELLPELRVKNKI